MAAAVSDQHGFNLLVAAGLAHAGRLPAEGKDHATRTNDLVERITHALVESSVLSVLGRDGQAGVLVVLAYLARRVWRVEQTQIRSDATRGQLGEKRPRVLMGLRGHRRVDVVRIGGPVSVPRERIDAHFGATQISP